MWKHEKGKGIFFKILAHLTIYIKDFYFSVFIMKYGMIAHMKVILIIITSKEYKPLIALCWFCRINMALRLNGHVIYAKNSTQQSNIWKNIIKIYTKIKFLIFVSDHDRDLFDFGFIKLYF